MAGEIILIQYEFYTLIFGWVMAVLFGFLTLASFKFTPARVFLKAWLKKAPVAWVKDRTGRGIFLVGKESDPGTIDLKGVGTVQLTEGSMVRESNSRAPVFDVFAEMGTSIPKEYAAIIQELREKGLKINKFSDYKHLVDLVADEKYASQFLEKIKDEKKKEEIRKGIEVAKKMEIKVMPFKTYKVHELAYMFPNNISPVYMDAKVTNAVNRVLKKEKTKKEFLIYAAVAVLILVIAAYMLLKLFKSPEPQVIVKTIETGVRVSQSATGNLTL